MSHSDPADDGVGGSHDEAQRSDYDCGTLPVERWQDCGKMSSLGVLFIDFEMLGYAFLLYKHGVADCENLAVPL